MFGSKLNSIESTSVLMAMRASLGLGLSPQEAIELQAESQSGKIGKVLSTVSFLVNKKEKKLADTLYRFGILSLEEKYVLENSGNRTKETINDIIDMREMKGKFDKTLLSMIWFPIVSVIIGATLVLMLYPKFIGPYHSLLKMAEYKGVTMSDKVGFLCIDHFELLQPFLFGYIAVVTILFLLYGYLRRYKPNLIYRIFPLAAYDDVPFILTYMRSLQKLGLPPVKIVDILYKANHNPGWKPLFHKLKNAILNSKPIYAEFKRFGYPKEIALFMQYAEMAKDFWGNIDHMIAFAIKRSEDGNNILQKTWGGLIMYVGYGIIIYFAVAIFMLIFQMQSVATALQS